MTRRPLITAQDLRNTPHGQLPEGALLTPLARDLLRRRGVHPQSLTRRQTPARRLLVANWKSHKTLSEAREFARELRQLLPQKAAGLVICPPFTAIAALQDALGGVAQLGAQDLSAHEEGAHTGEVAARHLADAGCRFAIVGHSERRAAGEGAALIRAKLRAALRGGLQPILCVGESADERRASRTESVVSCQLETAWEGLEPTNSRQLVVAYEPRWAIGQGVTPSEEEITQVLSHIRHQLERLCGVEPAQGVSLLYGGSVSPQNASRLLQLPGCAGALVGGASLSARRLLEIWTAGQRPSQTSVGHQ